MTLVYRLLRCKLQYRQVERCFFSRIRGNSELAPIFGLVDSSKSGFSEGNADDYFFYLWRNGISQLGEENITVTEFSGRHHPNFSSSTQSFDFLDGLLYGLTKGAFPYIIQILRHGTQGQDYA